MMSITCGSFLCSVCEALFLGRMSTDSLQREMAELRGTREETVRVVVDTRRTAQVNRWLEEVDEVDAGVRELVNALNNPSISGLGYLRLLCQLGDTLNGVRQLRSQGASFTVLTVPCGVEEAFSAVKGHPSGGGVGIVGVHGLGGRGNESAGSSAATGQSSTNLDAGIKVEGNARVLEGREGTLSEIRRLLIDDDGVGIIAVLGMAGSGKTTILRKIHDEFLNGGPFAKVIYATISRDGGILRLRRDLGAAMGLSNSSSQEEELAEESRALFSKKRVLLLLDDVRGELDLASVGVPAAHNESKIVFTASSSEICNAMGAQATVTVDLLDGNQSWELFQREVGADAVLQDPSIQKLAKPMVDGCGGRPLALVTMGRAMADERLPIEWEHAAGALKDLETTYRQKRCTDSETELFSRLKFSYDYLRDDKLRTCLLYCSLFPESHDIDREQLIEYWIGEGLLDFGEHASLYVARNRGHVMIRSLQFAGLLQSGSRDEERFVKLDVAVRDMVLWITSGKSDMENRLLVEAGKGLATVPRVEEWSSATRVSLMQNNIEKLPDRLPKSCSNMLTLLINECNPQPMPGPRLKGCQISEFTDSVSTFLPETFFRFFPTLRVLDLSHSPVDYLPATVSWLCELQYLNLSYTSIRSLPRTLGKLLKLRQLDLRYTKQLSEVPRETISSLKALQLLNLYGSGYLEVNLEELGSLKNFTELGVSLGDLRLFAGLQENQKLQRSATFLKLFQMNGLIVYHLKAAFSVWSRLRELRLEECNQLEEFVVSNDQLLFLQVLQLEHLKALSTVVLGLGDARGGGAAHVSPALRRLSHLGISHCGKLKHLEWVGRHPRLLEVHVHDCKAVEQLSIGGVSGGEENQDKENPLPMLRKLSLRGLRSLGASGISSLMSLLPPEAMEIEECPMLAEAAPIVIPTSN